MIRRLRALLAHARAGHRIGCETCAVRGTYVSLGRGYMLEPPVDLGEQFIREIPPWQGRHNDEPPADFGQQVFIPGPARSPVDAARERGEM